MHGIDLPHEVADRWRIQRELGRGARSTVFAAVSRKTGALAALKVRALGADSLMFRQAWSRTIALADSAIATTFDAVFTSEAAFLVTERLDETLGDRIARNGALGAADVCRIGARACAALAHAHAMNVAHGALTVTNILVTFRGPPPVGSDTGASARARRDEVKITDFGHSYFDRPPKDDLVALASCLDRALVGESSRTSTRDTARMTAPPRLAAALDGAIRGRFESARAFGEAIDDASRWLS